MKLVRNRWLFEDNDKTWFKFGKYNGEALEDVVSTKDGRWYIEHVMFKFDDLLPDVRAFLEKALEIEGDPLDLPHNHVSTPGKVTGHPVARNAGSLEELKARAKLKAERQKQQQKQEESKQALEKRKDEAEW